MIRFFLLFVATFFSINVGQCFRMDSFQKSKELRQKSEKKKYKETWLHKLKYKAVNGLKKEISEDLENTKHTDEKIVYKALDAASKKN